MRRRLMVILLFGTWAIFAAAGLVVFLGALRRAHRSDELMGSHDAQEPERYRQPALTHPAR